MKASRAFFAVQSAACAKRRRKTINTTVVFYVSIFSPKDLSLERGIHCQTQSLSRSQKKLFYKSGLESELCICPKYFISNTNYPLKVQSPFHETVLLIKPTCPTRAVLPATYKTRCVQSARPRPPTRIASRGLLDIRVVIAFPLPSYSV